MGKCLSRLGCKKLGCGLPVVIVFATESKLYKKLQRAAQLRKQKEAMGEVKEEDDEEKEADHFEVVVGAGSSAQRTFFHVPATLPSRTCVTFAGTIGALTSFAASGVRRRRK